MNGNQQNTEVNENTKALKVFLSHKHAHAEQVVAFRKYLGRLAPHRFNFFASSADVQQGTDWRQKLREKLKKSEWLIALKTNCENDDLSWVNREISTFTDLPGNPELGQNRRCIIIHDPANRDEVFSELQQFAANIDGCQKFLRHLLGSSRDSLGFNPYIGDDENELNLEAARLWGILVDKPPPKTMLPMARYTFTATDIEILSNDKISDTVQLSMNYEAAQIHRLSPQAGSFNWVGNFADLYKNMTEGQRNWMPLKAFLLKKLFEEKRTQKAWLLYPDRDESQFYIPIVSEIYEYTFGDKEFELIYFPIETGFPRTKNSEKDLLFHLMTLCFNTQWRLINRYKDKIFEYAAKERSAFFEITDEFKEMRSNLVKRVLIDFLKIHHESACRGVTNVEEIYNLFPYSERDEVENDFKKWVDSFSKIAKEAKTLDAKGLEESFESIQPILDSCLRRYSSKLEQLLKASDT